MLEDVAASSPKSTSVAGSLSGVSVISSQEEEIITDESLSSDSAYGLKVSRWPLSFTLASLLVCSLCMLGLLNYSEEGNPYKLWIPQNSDFVRNTDWLWTNFPPDLRFHSVIIKADNVLEPSVIQHILKIHDSVAKLSTKNGLTWSDKCYQLPVVDLNISFDQGAFLDDGNATVLDFSDADYNYDYYYEDPTTLNRSHSVSKRNIQGMPDPSIELYPVDYCEIVKEITQSACFESSLLELWAPDDYGVVTHDVVKRLTIEDILAKINKPVGFSEVFKRPVDFTQYLGGISRNASGSIIGAKATFIRFFGKINASAITEDAQVSTGKGQPVDEVTLEFESELLKALRAPKVHADPNIVVYLNVARSFNDLSEKVINTDVLLFGVGFGIVFIYVQLSLGKLNLVEQRPFLSAVGIGCIALTVFTSYGLCSLMGFVFSPMHNIIPFLLLGIGIDDMFVICQSLDNLPPDPSLTVETRVALAMKHAGVAITVTSITDVAVFAIGASTVLPALRSFCVFCAVGILVVYILQATIFVAALAKDSQRIASHRNGFLICYQHKNWTPQAWSQKNLLQTAFYHLGRCLVKPFVKVAVIVCSLLLLAGGSYGLYLLRQEFNPIWFIPPESYLSQWFAANEKFFPEEGERVTINIGPIDYSEELWKINLLVDKLKNETEIVSSVDSWFSGFKDYMEKNDLVQDFFETFHVNNTEFYFRLTQFLFSPNGAKYRTNFQFDQNIICGQESPSVMLSTIQFTHHLFEGPSEHIPAMNKIKGIVKSMNFSSRAFAVANEYASWETDEIIAQETVRNLLISVVCVFVTTIVLIGNFKACALVLLSVLMTLVNVGGFMHFWGLTIDVVSCVNLVIAVGLCVDYSAHIAHAFMTCSGSKNERTIKAMRDIGPAVLNGGFSTFLAFALTVTSQSHVFATFFKIFFLVVVFGLFHGLIFLPVSLSLLGPEPLAVVPAKAPTLTKTPSVKSWFAKQDPPPVDLLSDYIQDKPDKEP
eukprot:snap_masked-scaffold472_size162276-processed-gene-0.4 protein:Tk12251 transcript:snap_masked-scaffold472_size162276-processed-gene-0.4-mRNA-1 annotation:"hypothetical protein DAPPUDRAFT_306990"